MDLSEELHRLDLQQIEKLEKLVMSITGALKDWTSGVQMLSELEKQEAYQLVDLPIPENIPQNGSRTVEEVFVENKNEIYSRQKKLIGAMKKMVWDQSNSLRQDHDRRQFLLAQQNEVAELEEA